MPQAVEAQSPTAGPGTPDSSAPMPSGRPHCPAHPAGIPNPHRPPLSSPRLREQDVAGDTPSPLPAPAGPCPTRQILTSPRPLAPPRLSFCHRCPYRVHRDLCGFPHQSSFSRPAPRVPGGHCPLAQTPWPLLHRTYSRFLLLHPVVIASDPKPQRPNTAQGCCHLAPAGLESRCGHFPCVEVPSRDAVSRNILARMALVWLVRVLAGGPPSALRAWVPPRVAARSGCALDGRWAARGGPGPRACPALITPEPLPLSHLAWMTLPGPHPAR